MDTLELIFMLSNLLVIVFWLLMIITPYWRVTQRIMRSLWVVVPPALLYSALILPGITSLLPALANPTLDDMAIMLGTRSGAVIAWAHFVTFDLFVGRWAYLDNLDEGFTSPRAIPPLLMGLILFLCLLLGPLGLLLYLIVRGLYNMRKA